jgi:hypothetical protein
MGRWWEYDAGPSIKVPEPEGDGRTEAGVFCFAGSFVAWVVMIVSFLLRAWAICWSAIAVGLVLSLVGIWAFKDRAPKRVIE